MAALRVWYGQEGDFLEVTFEDTPASPEEVADDVSERRSRDGRVVGSAIINFSRHDRDSLHLPISVQVLPAA